MRPYFAVIQDAFREALASRVLWVLLVLITLLLVLLAPLGYRQQVTRELAEGAVRELPRFIEHLRDEFQKTEPSPSQRIVSMLDEPLRRDLLAFHMPKEGDVSGAFKFIRVMKEVREGINRLLLRRDFYDEKTWGKHRPQSDEARELAKQVKQDIQKLPDDELGRWNRLALEAAYPEFIAASPPTSLRFRYLWYDFGEPLPIRKIEFQRMLESLVERATRWIVGTIGVFVAILVTAAIIPQMFDPGSLNLLLSKPVRRWLLFLSKFCGGCMFILLNAAYLVIGMWLILGLRFGMWDPRILLCIPVYVFMFAIYYTVSALVGLLWRNAIACVGVTVVFWLMCFGVGVSKSGVEQLVLNKTRFIQLILAKKSLLGVNEMGLTYVWEEKKGEWREVFRSENEEEQQRRIALSLIPSVPAELRPLGPVYDEKGDQLISAVRSLRSGRIALTVGPRSQDWAVVSGVSASLGTLDLLCEADGRILVVSSLDLYRLVGDPKEESQSVRVFGFSLPLPGRDPFVAVGPDPGLGLLRPAKAAVNRDTGELAVYRRGRLTVLRKNAQDRYERRLEQKLADDYRGDVALAFGGDTLLVGREDGQVIAVDAKSLEVRRTFTVEGKNQPRFVTAAPGGKHFAVVFHHGALWIYDRRADSMTRPPVTGQGDISCCFFPSASQALVVDRTARVTEYEWPDWRATRRCAPPLSLLERVYRYAILPLYTVFPKPGELDKTVQYLLSGKETAEMGEGGDLSAAQKELEPWRPVWSSLAFMAVVLALGCWYLERQDF